MYLITCSSHEKIFVAYFILGGLEISRYKFMLVSLAEEGVLYCQTQNRGNTVALRNHIYSFSLRRFKNSR